MHADSEAEVLHLDDVIIDVGARKVRHAGRDVPMGRLSFEFLLALARVAPNALATDDLVKAVWGQTAVTDETVQQRASLVRQALGDAGPTNRYIETVRGHGYRLIPVVSRSGRSGAHVRRVTGLVEIFGRPFAMLVKILVVVALVLVITWISMLLRGAK